MGVLKYSGPKVTCECCGRVIPKKNTSKTSEGRKCRVCIGLGNGELRA